MDTPRISASSYSNTAPLIWSFLYGSNHGKVELILDNAPARSAELLAQNRVAAALVPVIASQFIDGVKLIPDVCVGARERVRSVCIVTKGDDLTDVKSVALDISSRTSVVLTKIIFREFLGFEPEWRNAEPNIDAMLAESDAALLIGDPALSIAECGMQNSDLSNHCHLVSNPDKVGYSGKAKELAGSKSAIHTFDLAELWHQHTGLGFVFAMWMTCRQRAVVDFAAARDEGVEHLEEIAANYAHELRLTQDEMFRYLNESISYSVDGSMESGMKLFFELAAKHKQIAVNKPLIFAD
ncbi:MAG: menaquinone biosynthetic enzyme MqnA/MqnD family protein [Pyrinomonadaceae bacterium]